MAALGQTIAVFDKSGKAVSTSKQLINVFKEAKLAYRERKAEIVAGRQADLKEKQRHRPRTLKLADGDDVYSTTPSRRSPRSTQSYRHEPKAGPSHHRRSIQRSETSPIIGSARAPRLSPRSSRCCETPPPEYSSHNLTRRHSAEASPFPTELPPRPTSADSIDMDLAYGDLPPDLISPSSQQQNLQITPYADEEEVRSLVTKVRTLLEEADCLQASASAMITSLQNNPDAMAAVALTLAEISNIAKRLAPGALMAMKGSSPAVFALLASPQFLIAAGVGVGLTVVCLGGYKIVKKIKAQKAAADPGMDEMLEIGGQVSTIETWRRGISLADEEEQPGSISVVEGEFITPTAAAMSRLSLNELRSTKDGEKMRRKKHRSSSSRSKEGVEGGSDKGSEKASRREREKKKERKPSQLRLMFS